MAIDCGRNLRRKYCRVALIGAVGLVFAACASPDPWHDRAVRGTVVGPTGTAVGTAGFTAKDGFFALDLTLALDSDGIRVSPGPWHGHFAGREQKAPPGSQRFESEPNPDGLVATVIAEAGQPLFFDLRLVDRLRALKTSLGPHDRLDPAFFSRSAEVSFFLGQLLIDR